MLEGDNKLEPKTFDNDPHIIPIPPNPEVGAIQFRTILERGHPMTLDDGSTRMPLGVLMTNFTKRTGFVNAYMKGGYLIISLIRSDEE